LDPLVDPRQKSILGAALNTKQKPWGVQLWATETKLSPKFAMKYQFNLDGFAALKTYGSHIHGQQCCRCEIIGVDAYITDWWF
jgi:hypothetical protein